MAAPFLLGSLVADGHPIRKSSFLCCVTNESELGFLKGALEPEEIEAEEEEEAYANRPAGACKEEHLYPTKESD